MSDKKTVFKYEMCCHQCGGIFGADRSDARVCSPQCRQSMCRGIKAGGWKRHEDSLAYGRIRWVGLQLHQPGEE